MPERDGLKVLQAAREFRDRVLLLVRRMPRLASSDLKAQLADAVRSVASNISEGLGRGTPADQVRFLWMANGSLEEAQEGLRECINSALISKKEFYREWNRSVVISKMLAGLISQRKG
ncbi:MAG TPA: four helix bundle protein [Gemmatimonadaceae bacterium]|nr:four helix bundle protein [Gemmatimonadaceae bacterium]